MSNSIAIFLKQKRKETDLTQEQFALKAGVGLRFLRDIEQEKPNQTLDKVNQVLSMFGAKLGVIMESEFEDNER
ncbi:MAG: helix-turn-helix transcriptional regulator [Bacteroidota bacterium]